MQKKQSHQQILDFVAKNPDISKSEIKKQFKGGVDTLIKNGYLEVILKEKQASALKASVKQHISYSEDQKNAIDKINALQPKTTALLYGVTASGKSEVFFNVIQHQIKKGKQVLLLVPEISLVSQMVKNLLQRFSGDVMLYHSNLNEQEKYECYQSVNQSKVSVVVGTRSSIFLPFSNLGLIIIDEEHDSSYKQDNKLLYYTHEIANQRINYHQCVLVLASATPNLIHYAKAYKKRFTLIEMPNKLFDVKRDVQVINMQYQARKNDYILSTPLLDAMQKTLDNNEQIVLILNKRGFASYIKCLNCGNVEKCENCDVALKYHIHDETLKCHTCGYVKPYLKKCSACNSDTLTYQGLGTQKLEQYVKQKFPNHKIARLDKDTTAKKNTLSHTLTDFEKGEYHILIGTQMLSKGLDFANVTLVGMINGDDLLSREEYTSVETMFQLLVQSFGRSGRKKSGKVFLQVYDENHYAIKCAVKEDYKAFFTKEMHYRHLANYPPYVYLASLTLYNTNYGLLVKECEIIDSLLDFEYLGPNELYRVHNEYRMRYIFKTKDEIMLREKLMKLYEYIKTKLKSKIEIDFNFVK